jgi:hypothetical protein
MKTRFKLNGLLFLFIVIAINTYSQEKNTPIKYGFVYGFGEQGIFPFTDDDYLYETKSYKAQLNYVFKEKGSFSFEFNIEPSVFISKHQLLNKHFIRPDYGSDYLEERDRQTTKKTMKELSLGIGVISRYNFTENMSVYALGSVGPMIIDTRTERMAKGFAFSDILSFGLSYKIEKIILDLRYGYRHVSNFQLKSPNSGYNSTNFEIGFLLDL